MRNVGLDLLRSLAAAGIVGCHLGLSPCTLGAEYLLVFCDTGVAIFALMSGFFMVESVEKDERFVVMPYIKKRCQRLLPIYFVWTLAYLALGLLFDLLIRHGLNPKLTNPQFYLSVLFMGGASTHLWFIVCLLYAQITLRLVVAILWRVPRWVFFVLGSLLVCWANRNSVWLERYPLRLTAFLLMGYGVRDFLCSLIRTLPRLVPIALTVCIAFIHAYFSVIARHFSLDAVLAIGIMACFMQLNGRGTVGALARYLGECSMGVFLIHPVIAVAVGLVAKRLFQVPYGVFPVGLDWLFVWLISCAVVAGTRHIPAFFKYFR